MLPLLCRLWEWIWPSPCFSSPSPMAPGGWSNRIASRAPSSSAGSPTVRSGLVVMEACGSAHHWARWLNGLGIEVRLLPAAYIRAYVKRNKTDAADACALLEAARCAEIVPVRVKSIEQQALQGLHRTRSLWMGTRTSRINALRGFCREFGIVIAQGSRLGVEQIGRVLADPHSPVPTLIRGTMTLLVEEIRLLEVRIAQLERELTALARQSPACTTLLSIPGVGLLTATAMVAATSGEVSHFRDARHFASWFGLTPKEHSSGGTRHLGRISKRGDRYLRMLLTHGARSVLRAASVGGARRQDRRWPAAMGAGRAGPLESQQGDLRARQQAGANLLRDAARRRTVRRRSPEQEGRAHGVRAARLNTLAPYSPHPEPCVEIDRPSWQPGSSPPRLTPITLPAAARLPLVTIGAAGSADSMSARAIMSPLQMPDIRLQAHPTCHNYRSVSSFAGGVHIRKR